MVQTTLLPNGIKVVTEQIEHVHSVSIGIWVKTGSRFETREQQGISHFIEHMLFKGTPRHTAVDIARRIDSVGGFINAFTGKEYTCFYVKILKQHLPLAIDLLTDIFFNSLFAPDDIEKERSVIMQEIHMIKDTPDDYIQDLFNEAYFSGHPLGYPIQGEAATIESLDRERLVSFFTCEYLQPQRIIIAAAGDLTHEQVLGGLQGTFNGLAPAQEQPAGNSFAPQQRVIFNYRRLEQVHVCMGTIGLSHLDPQRYALYVLNTLFGGSMSSRLFQEIREQQGLAYSVYSFISSYVDTGVFGVYMGVKKELAQQAIAIVLHEIEKLTQEKIGAEELDSAKEQLKGNLLLSTESTDNRMSRLAKSEIYYNSYIPLEDVVAEIDAVTSDAVQELARSMFTQKFVNYTFLGPLRAKDLPERFLFIPE
jgi:predicted Zn-dependent peptidase